MEGRLERMSRNGALVREVNERINTLDRESAGSDAGEGVETFRFHCECGREGTATSRPSNNYCALPTRWCHGRHHLVRPTWSLPPSRAVMSTSRCVG